MSAKTFNYVDWHRKGGASQLRPELEPLRGGKPLGNRVKPDKQFVGTLPRNEGMMGQRHADVMATYVPEIATSLPQRPSNPAT